MHLSNDKNLKDVSMGGRYILMHLSRLIGEVEKEVKNVSITKLAKLSGMCDRSVHKYLNELKESNVIEINRNVIFGKGPGQNSYWLFEKISLTMKHEKIVDRVLLSGELNAQQKFIYITLLSLSDEFGVVRNVGLTRLSNLIAISRQALKANLSIISELRFLFGYSPGGNVEIIPGKGKSVFYLNLIRFKPSELKCEIEQKFLTYNDVTSYFIKNKKIKTKLNCYIQSLSTNNKKTFFNLINSKVDEFTGALITQIANTTDEFKVKYIGSYIAHLKENIFVLDKNNHKVVSVKLGLFRKTLKTFTHFSIMRSDIQNYLLGESDTKKTDEALKLHNIAKDLSDEIIYLVHLFAFWMYFDIFSPEGKKYVVIRKYHSEKSDEGLSESSCMLISK